MKRRSWSLAFELLGLLGLCTGCYMPSPPGADDPEAARDSQAFRCLIGEDADRMADQVLQLVNLERAEEGLPPVVANPTLAQIAGDYACRMIELDFFGHKDLETEHGPGERAIAARYFYYAIGENLAAGQQTAAEVMTVWMESPSHRAIILDPKWEEIGIAVRSGGDYSVYWVQEFADPADY